MSAGRRKGLLAFVLAFAAAVAVGCGSSDDSGSGTTLTWFIFNEPSGSPQAAADKCEKESNGAYKIKFEFLPADADGQREQLVRRLGAKDSSIDIIGMDVIWTGEFANAGWIEPLPGHAGRAGHQERLPERRQDRRLRGQALRGAVQLQHAAALVPQGPGPEAADDLGRDDRRGREARSGASGHDPGPGQQVRGLHGLGQRADRVGRRARSSPARKTVDLAAGADREGARGDGQARRLPGRGRPTSRPPTRTRPGSASRPATRPS